jgi:hypothetical protein
MANSEAHLSFISNMKRKIQKFVIQQQISSKQNWYKEQNFKKIICDAKTNFNK